MRALRLFPLLVLCAAFALTSIACDDGGDDGNGTDTTTTDMTAGDTNGTVTGDPVAGQAIYEMTPDASLACVSCHGMNGEGNDGLMAPALAGSSLSDAEMATIIMNGVEGTTMVAYPNLSDQQIADVIAYIRTL